MADQTTTALLDPALTDAADGPVVLAARLRQRGMRRTARHQHARGQLLGAHQGLLRIAADDLHWLLPAGHVAWIPPLLPHALLSADGFDGWSLYFNAEACLGLPATPRIFQPNALLQAATTLALRWPHQPLDAAQARLAGVIADEIAASMPLPLALPQPRDRRLQKIAAALARAPEDGCSIEEWAASSGLSGRSLARHWLAETGMTLSQWRQRLRVLLSLPRLLSGEPVISVALSMGYETPSAFIAVFKREMGVTPARYGKGDGGD